ncbi:MAG: hypothetical protein ACM3ZB_04580 [bacterium]|jgi:hypothetical protein
MLAKADARANETREREFPEIEIRGEIAVIRLDTPEGVIEERQVKLPRTTWA